MDIANLKDIEQELQGVSNPGTLYHDHYSKGVRNGKRRYHNRWCAEIMIEGERYRYRNRDQQQCLNWLNAVRMGRIKPTDNNADWMRMEQKKDLPAKYNEIIVSALEESLLVHDYSKTGNLDPICNYVTTRLLPHMVYYCCHSLSLGRDTSIDYSCQAVALLLKIITDGKPVTNMTRACKRMIRVRKAHHSFWYYEKDAPENIRNIVNGLDLSPLADVWKLTKDRRI